MINPVRSALAGFWGAWKDPATAAALVRRVAHEDDSRFPPQPITSVIRRIGVRAGWWHDFTALTHAQVMARQTRIARQPQIAELLVETPPSMVLRLDDFPIGAAPIESIRRVHDILCGHNVPYLLAVTPFVVRDGQRGLTRKEWEVLSTLAGDGVEIAVHGFTHESRSANLASELAGLPRADLLDWLTRTHAGWSEAGLVPNVFVAPFNAYDAATLPDICARFPVVCGGPESVLSVGAVAPCFLDSTWYLPSYRGVYDVSSPHAPSWRRVADSRLGGIVPVTMHWAAGIADDFSAIRALARTLAGRTLSWTQLLAIRRRILELV